MEPILIVPIVPYDEEIVRAIPSGISKIFGLPVLTEGSRRLDPSFAFDRSRKQYHSTKILSTLIDLFSDFHGKVLGITVADLHIPVLTYVFGEAQLSGKAAIISTYRLDDALYGLRENPALLLDRSLKESIHELGHTFGLYHCVNFECVMHSSTVAEEIDLKNAQFCRRCKNSFQTF